MNATTAVAFLALVFAMTGGAFAVTSHDGGAQATAAKSKAKPKGKPGRRGPAGPKGATGAAGAAGAKGETGPAGSAGAAGTKGEAGAAGANGESVISAKLNGEEEGCQEGGSKFTVGGKTTTACNGEKGEEGKQGPPGTTGFTKFLPSGETETGAWSVYEQVTPNTVTNHVFKKLVAVSFPIPLKEGNDNSEVAHVVRNCEHLEGTPKSECEASVKAAEAFCPGTVEVPRAKAGNLCIYQGVVFWPENPAQKETTEAFEPSLVLDPGQAPGTSIPGISSAGAVFLVEYRGPNESEQPAFTMGTWAVTAP